MACGCGEFLQGDPIDSLVPSNRERGALSPQSLGGDHMKEHFYSRKFHQLTYWDSRNTEVTVNCYSMLEAKRIIKAHGHADYPLTSSKLR
jgi:hypothetical protein